MEDRFCEKEFRSIYNKLKQRGGNQKYEWFQACGDPTLRNGLMVVGKAVNDWHEFCISNTDFEEVYEPIPSTLNINGDIEAFFNKNYNINRSAFWRTVRNTAKGLFNCGNHDFGKYLIYSDLYKVALPKKNPNNTLMQLELSECIEILRQEIQFWKPAYVLFLTGWEWADPFLTDFELKDGLVCKEKSQHDTLLEDWGQFPDGCRVAVIPHPQGKAEKILAGKAIAFFNDFRGLQDEVAKIVGAFEGKWTFNVPQEEISFTLLPGWNNQAVPLVIQTDLNILCFRIGIWTKDAFFAPLAGILSQKLNRKFLCNPAWRGGYTEIKFSEANEQLIKLVENVCTSIKNENKR